MHPRACFILKGPLLTSFETLGLSEKALKAVELMGYTEPTPVQEKAIPVVLEGSDIIAAAKTGTGKTGAFALPTLDRLPHCKQGEGPLLLIITPTRELAAQIGEVCKTVAQCTHHRVVTVVGGVAYQPQIDALAKKTDVLIATPGRLIDLIDQQAVKLSNVRALVLDEADRMLDMGFLPSVKKIVAKTPATRQTLLFSATIDKSVTKNTSSLLNDPVTVEIARKGEVADTIDQYLVRTPQLVKPALIKAVLEERGANRVIVFCRTRSRADSCCRRLKRAGFNAAAIHSDRSQNQRRRALEGFATGDINIICATDVLARGIDVEAVDYVVNYDLPATPEDYVHRIGRTGRAGIAGFSISFATPDDAQALRDIEKLTKTRIPEIEVVGFNFEEAEAEAQSRQQAFQAKKDPEIAQVKRDLAKKRKKKEKERAAKQAENEQAEARGGAGKRRGKKAGATATKGGSAAHSSKRAHGDNRTAHKNSRSGKQSGKRTGGPHGTRGQRKA